MCTVFEINELCSLYHESVRPLRGFDHDVVGFDI